jgi:hypothetical protein
MGHDAMNDDDDDDDDDDEYVGLSLTAQVFSGGFTFLLHYITNRADCSQELRG